ncbi:hypothetical protein ASE85_21525 [Sphingobium sp. Leaf26]|nr:hypothetical protein ASE85_21525 [Sphingobium sp. Leaf26]
MVANQTRYPGPEALPFDWRHRRGTVLYNLPDGATGSERQAARRQLATELANRIGPVLSTITATRPMPLSLLTREPDAADPAVWDGATGGITFNESGLYDERKAARPRRAAPLRTHRAGVLDAGEPRDAFRADVASRRAALD